MSRTKRFLIAMGLTLFVISARGCVVWDGPYEGYVRDKETGEPLQGAVVAAFWYRRSPAPGHDAVWFFDAEEDVTNEEGMFHIRGQRWINVIPFSHVTEPRFTYYAMGHQSCHGVVAAAVGDCGQPTIRLNRRGQGEVADSVHSNMGAWNDPQDWVPHLEDLMRKDKATTGASNLSSQGGSPPWTSSESSSSAR